MLITINEDISLRAIYLKKEPPSYIGFSEEEVLKKVNTAFYSYFETFDQHYGISNNGKYYIDLKPNIPIGELSEVITHQIQVDDNVIIVKSAIKLPVLKKNYNVDAIKDDFKNNIKEVKDLNRFLSNSVEFDESNTVTYNKEIHLIKKDDDLVIKHIDKPDGIFLEYPYQAFLMLRHQVHCQARHLKGVASLHSALYILNNLCSLKAIESNHG